MAKEPVERIFVRIRELNNLVADVCCKHPGKEEADESFFQQMNLIFASPDTHWGLDTLQYLLEGQHSGAEPFQEISTLSLITSSHTKC